GELMARLEAIDSESYIQARKSNFTSFRWNDGEGYNIVVPATESFFIVKPKEGCPFDREKTVGFFSKELSAAEKVFAERGFVLDVRNSSTGASDKSLYDYIQSYKKNDEMCAVAVDPDCSSYQGGGTEMAHQLRVSCGSGFAEARAEQIPFLDALDLKNTNSALRIGSRSGDFFRVGVGGFRAGSAAILKKEGDSYRVLFIGQEGPPCSLLEKEQIPHEVLSSIGGGSCFTDDGRYIRVE
ncbi:hypothetical protein GWN26_07170, partial [Candidatus Saccharibacteria bacterium]|nr:hypothetical protein [Candidatus Saccharibacteria bacterium]NIV03771.1 hypothetical protein [Calditrichia bacterium]NIV98930.1 hypothetical protein [Candidatus Saccharibacteria bacterium]